MKHFQQPLTQLLRCVGSFLQSFYSQSLRSAFGPVQKSLLSPATVSKAVKTGLRAISRTWHVNHRFIIAVVFMLLLAPLAGIGYHAFDRKVVMVLFEGQHFYDAHGVRWDFWYHKNLFFFFMAQGPHVAQALFCIGVFFLFPENSRRAYFLIIPLAIAISKIIWLCVVNSNDEFYATPGFYYVVVGAAVALVLLFTFDYLTRRKYHDFDALCRRILQIIQARRNKLISEERADEFLEQEAVKLKAFNQQY